MKSSVVRSAKKEENGQPTPTRRNKLALYQQVHEDRKLMIGYDYFTSVGRRFMRIWDFVCNAQFDQHGFGNTGSRRWSCSQDQLFRIPTNKEDNTTQLVLYELSWWGVRSASMIESLAPGRITHSSSLLVNTTIQAYFHDGKHMFYVP